MWFCNCMDCSIRSNSFHTLNCLTLCPVPTMTLFLQNCLSSSWHEMQWLHVERLHTYFIFYGDAKLDGELSVINLSNRSLLHYFCQIDKGAVALLQINYTFFIGRWTSVENWTAIFAIVIHKPLFDRNVSYLTGDFGGALSTLKIFVFSYICKQQSLVQWF